MTLGERLEGAGFRPSGFDYLRLGLSLGVVAAHSIDTSYGWDVTLQIWGTPLGRVLQTLLPMFFALSGFLVAGSLERSRTVACFMGLRAIRIYPALMVEVLLSAFILGPLMTNVVLTKYFTGASFFSYLWNLLGDPHYYLPGVFENNPFPPKVNAQLWTVPYELMCYTAIGAIALVGGRNNRQVVLAITAAAIVLSVGVQLYKHGLNLPSYTTTLPGPFLVFSFLAGICFYLYRDCIPDSPLVFAGAVVVVAICLVFNSIGAFIVAFPISYVTAYLGVRNPKRIVVLRGADYSYGIFLYHFAIQQSLMATLPWARAWYWNLLLTLPLVSAFAAFSWNVVEKPALRLRQVLMKWETRYIQLRERRGSGGFPSQAK